MANTGPRNSCNDCGKVIGKHARRCKSCGDKYETARKAHAARVIEAGKCPDCGPLRRNLALSGWYQCAALGEPSFRAPEYRNAPACSFQIFA